jgi:hypothetical protein
VDYRKDYSSSREKIVIFEAILDFSMERKISERGRSQEEKKGNYSGVSHYGESGMYRMCELSNHIAIISVILKK